MATSNQIVRAAVVQAAPVAFDRERALEKVRCLTEEAAHQGAKLVVFPEAFVSAYPRGLTFGAVVGNRTAEVSMNTRCLLSYAQRTDAVSLAPFSQRLTAAPRGHTKARLLAVALSRAFRYARGYAQPQGRSICARQLSRRPHQHP
jgi:predicted amidohydrolase